MGSPDLPAGLVERARAAYERARLRRALATAAALALLPLSTALWCAPPALAAGAALGVLVAGAAFLWRGQGFGRAVLPATLAAAPALLLPAVIGGLGGNICDGHTCWNVCVAGCVAAGVGAGLVLWRSAPAPGAERMRFLSAGMTMAALAALPACTFAGLFGAAGLVVGLVGSTAPALLRPAWRT